MISPDEQIDLFLNKYSYKLIKLLEELKSKNNNIILNKTNNKTTSNFIDIILHNVDLQQMYLNHYNL